MSRKGHALDRRLVRQMERVLRDVGLAPGGSLVIAVSGGPDSLALAHILWRLRDSLRLTLYGAHLDHGIRGQEGADDAAFVQQTLWGLHIPTFIRRARVPRRQGSSRLPPEAAARQVRYRFLAELAQELHADAVAVGHTADDQAETVLLHLVRGTGIAGLTGMQILSTLRVDGLTVRLFRPLLEIRREDTEGYCDLMELHPRQDSTNLSLEPLRNRLRLRLLPAMEEYNPAVKGALRRLAQAAARDVAFLDEQAQQVWPQVVREESEGIALERQAFASLHPALQSHLLRLAYARLQGTPQELEQAHVEEMLHQMGGSSGRSAHLPGDVTFLVEHSRALLTRAPRFAGHFPALQGVQPLVVSGTTHLPGWTVTAEMAAPDVAFPEEEGTGGYQANLDLDAVGTRLWVRTRLQGDRFQPLGMEQEKRLQDFLVDAHVPSHLRDQIPLVVNDQGMVWVVGHRIAHWARLTPETRQALRLTFRQ